MSPGSPQALLECPADQETALVHSVQLTDEQQAWMVQAALEGKLFMCSTLAYSEFKNAAIGWLSPVGKRFGRYRECEEFGTWKVGGVGRYCVYCCQHAPEVVSHGYDRLLEFIPTGERVDTENIKSSSSARRTMRKISLRWSGRWVTRPSKRSLRRAARQAAKQVAA
jgi:hypothetical protein